MVLGKTAKTATTRSRAWFLALLGGLLLAGCGENRRGNGGQQGDEPRAIKGLPIRELASGNTNGERQTTIRSNLATASAIGSDEEGYLRLGFDRLSDFKYTVYEYYTEGVSGRPLLKSDDTIPAEIKIHDGRKVVTRGFVLPLRTRKGRVTEFLLLRDQGVCCFGPQAQINHFIRVNFPKGREFTQGIPYRVKGTLRVGETYVQGYLTGIYGLEADAVEEAGSRE